MGTAVHIVLRWRSEEGHRDGRICRRSVYDSWLTGSKLTKSRRIDRPSNHCIQWRTTSTISTSYRTKPRLPTNPISSATRKHNTDFPFHTQRHKHWCSAAIIFGGPDTSQLTASCLLSIWYIFVRTNRRRGIRTSTTSASIPERQLREEPLDHGRPQHQ
jgi:hypothetical protein